MLLQTRFKKSIASRLWGPTNSRGLGIDIGQIQTKIVSVECQRGEANHICSTTIPTLLGNDQEHAASSTPLWSSIEFKHLARRIGQLLGGGFSAGGYRIAVTLSMSVCDYRTIYLPGDARVRPTIIQEAIASATDDQRPRCIALLSGGSSAAEETKSTIRCFSLPEELSWSAAQAFDEVGLTPHAINGLPWCLANAVELSAQQRQSNATALIIDWSYGAPTLVAVRNGNIDYVRCLSHGSLAELTSQACADYHMNFAEAQHWIGTCLAAPSPSDAVDNSTDTCDWIHDRCKRMADEIETAVEFLRWRHQSNTPPILWMTGGGTQLPGLKSALQSHLPFELNSWKWSNGTTALTAEYATAAALAFQEIRRAQR